MQFTGELVYDFVRTGIGRDIIGSRDYKPFVPLLLTLFSFILVNNLYGITPFVSFPADGAYRLPDGAGASSCCFVYNIAGIRRQGFRSLLQGRHVHSWRAEVRLPDPDSDRVV